MSNSTLTAIEASKNALVQSENLATADAVRIPLIWSARRQRMAERRQYFEPLWRSGISKFFSSIVSDSNAGAPPLYNSLYEQYDYSLFSRDGMRFNNIKYPLLHAVTMRAMASEYPNRPKASFTAYGSNDPTKGEGFKYLFNQVLYEMNSDEEDFEILLDKRIFGSSIALVLTESYEVTVKDPVYNEETGKTTYKEKTKKIKQCKYRKLDLRHVYLDEHCCKTNLEDCKYAMVDEYYSAEEFLLKFKEFGEVVYKASQTTQGKGDEKTYSTWYDSNMSEYVKVTHCFDTIFDCYHIIVNDQVLINEPKAPIPRIAGRKGKEIPLAMAVQYKFPNAPYGYADPHITSGFNHIKNLVRVMLLEITQKAAKPLMAIDPLSNFDEQGFEWGADFIRVAPENVKEIKMNPDLKSLYDMDAMTDNDVIRVTGININDTTNADTSETARKTVIRRESQNALIELTMNYMTNSFYKRLYTLLKDDIRLHYGESLKNGEEVKIKTDGVKLKRAGTGFDSEKVAGFRYFDLEAGDIDFDSDLDLEMGNIASSKELDKALASEGVEIASQIQGGFDPIGLAKWVQETFSMPDTVLAGQEQNISEADPNQLAQEGLDPSLLPDNIKLQLQNAQVAEQQGLPQLPAVGAPVATAPLGGGQL